MSITKCFIQQCDAFNQSSTQNGRAIERWVVALSGGLDSMVLLDLAHKLLPQEHVVALHVNHQQQECAEQWQQFCQQQCALRNIEYFPFQVSPVGKSEQALRDSRYACFSSFLNTNDCLLLAHHAIDQAETVLFRLVRGAGSKGLSAMPVSRNLSSGQLLRPLLSVSKTLLQSYAAQGLQWVEDPSNRSLIYDRNFIRHKVVQPLLEHWPKACEQMALSAQLLANEYQVLENYLAADVKKIANSSQLDIQKWSAYPESKGLLLLKHWLGENTDAQVSRKQLQCVLESVIQSKLDSKGHCQIGNYVVRRYKKQLYLINTTEYFQSWPKLNSFKCSYTLSQGVLGFEPSCQGIEWLEGMYLSNKQDGMSIKVAKRPLKKLKKIFQEQQIAPWLREQWPILMYKNEIVAIPGICINSEWMKECKNKSYFYPQWQPL